MTPTGALSSEIARGFVVTDTAVPSTGSSSHDSSASDAYGELITGLRTAFASGLTRPIEWRKRQLQGLLDMLRNHEGEFIAALQEDLGRPVVEAFAADIGISRPHVQHLIDHLDEWARPEKQRAGFRSLPGKAEIIKEPLGVALVISPWNYPIQLLVEPLAAALAAGNCVVAKPSELSPACTATLARLIPQYVDNDAVVVVEGGVPETTALLEHAFDHILFTGSTNVGKIVMAAAAKHLTPVTLELGGKSPTIIAADANLKVAAKRVLFGKFINAGQTCIAPDYVLVEASVRDRFVDELVGALGQFYGRDVAASPDFGRIITERQHGRLMNLIGTAGGRIVVGGDGDVSKRYIAPTIIVDPDLDSELMTQEIFGPILPIISVDSIPDAIDFVNARPKPLALYVFSESGSISNRVLAETSSGGACVNHTMVHLLPDTLPFGGVGPSGMGSYHGRAGFDTFSHHRSVVRHPTQGDLPLLYAPYTGVKEKLIRLVFK